ncbi:MAG: TrmH family RNA methyltransferase [Galactobacter sp.]
MPIVTIGSLPDPRQPSDPESASGPDLSDYVGLTDAALRSTRDTFIAESTVVVRRALDAGYTPRSFLLDERHTAVAEEFSGRFPDVPVFIGASEVLESLTGFHLHRGALASFRRPAPANAARLLSSARRVVVLEDVTEHTNVGAIFRTAAGLGVDAILLSPRCADPLYRRAIRVSMGTVFSQPWARLDTWPDGVTGVQWLKDQGFHVCALELTEDALPIDDPALRHLERLALILGTEGAGVLPRTLESVDASVIIPMEREVSSLNVGAAAAIAMWELRAR